MVIVTLKGVPLEIEAVRRGSKKHVTVPFDDMLAVSQTESGACIERSSGHADHILCTPDQYVELIEARREFIKQKEEATA